VCWGPDCQRVHDIIDEMSEPGNDVGVPEDSCIMTTWHDSEPLREALWFFLVNSWPDEHYENSTRVALAISVGSSEWRRRSRRRWIAHESLFSVDLRMAMPNSRLEKDLRPCFTKLARGGFSASALAGYID
jgi:hypothetical protein